MQERLVLATEKAVVPALVAGTQPHDHPSGTTMVSVPCLRLAKT
jgi:hypothetical protein